MEIKYPRVPPGGKLRHFQGEPTGSCRLCCDPFLPLFAWKKKKKRGFLLLPGQESARAHSDTGAGGGRAGPRHGPRAGVDPAGHKGEGRRTHPAMVYLTPVSLAASAGSGGSAGENPLWKKLRCGGSIPVASSGPSALGIRFTGDEASWSPRAPGQHGWASTGAASGSSRGRAGCATSPARSPTETRLLPVPAAQPQHPNPAPGRAVTSWRFNGWRGRAWTQRAGGGTAQLAAGPGCNWGSAPALRGISEERQWQSFPAVLGVCQGMNSLALGTCGLPGSGCRDLRREVFDSCLLVRVYIGIILYICI